MSNPNLPNITPTIDLTRDDVLNLLFSSIAMEELGLAHIINAEGEKIQFALGTLPGSTPATLAEMLSILCAIGYGSLTLEHQAVSMLSIQPAIPSFKPLPQETIPTILASTC